MTSLTSVLLSGLSGLRAAQANIGAASQNVANANTPGWARTQVVLTPHTDLGDGGGVDISGVTRAANRFLAAASYIAQAAQGSSAARADILNRAQANFGDPSDPTSMFGLLNQFWSSAVQLGADPSSALQRGSTVSALQATYSEVQRVGQSVQNLVSEADQRIADQVKEAQDLMNRIADFNTQIRLTKSNGADSTSAENAQSQLINQLSSLMDVVATPTDGGGVSIRTGGGALLVGTQAATISYTPSDGNFASHGMIQLNPQLGSGTSLEPMLGGGSIKGLLQVRDQDLPSLARALGGFAGALGDALNQVHNENASSPAIGNMVGRQTGLLATDSLNFTGKAVIGVVDANGVLKDRLHVDFDAGVITSDLSSTSYSFSGGAIGDLASALNSALTAETPPGSANFANGVMSLNVGNGGGLVIQQDPTAPSDRAGRGFSHFFGLNDLVSSTTPMFFQNGIKGADLLGFNSGGEIDYQVRDTDGRFIANRSISISGALASPTATWDDLLNALNASGTGLGDYGVFSRDAATGQISFAPNPKFQATLTSDTTQRGGTGVSFSALNGLSEAATAGRSLTVNVNSQIIANPLRLAVGQPDLTAALGTQVVEGGDNHGAAALVAARDSIRSFDAAGALTAQSTTLGTYAARLGGEAGRLASDSQRSADGAQAIATAANDRRSQVESVSMDDELVKMTTYQNAYSASARVIQAAAHMLDILINLGIETPV
ncbi:MAG: flagellar hook-associated protein FlgK [Proteobacteria bacterium]|nr:flagellar hook-associated protein FlgK [Pseudomonadota bacterium]